VRATTNTESLSIPKVMCVPVHGARCIEFIRLKKSKLGLDCHGVFGQWALLK